MELHAKIKLYQIISFNLHLKRNMRMY